MHESVMSTGEPECFGQVLDVLGKDGYLLSGQELDDGKLNTTLISVR